jgi:hypothetical protein
MTGSDLAHRRAALLLRRYGPWAVVYVVIASLFTGFAIIDDRAGRRSLSVLEPFISLLESPGRRLSEHALGITTGAGIVTAFLCVLCAVAVLYRSGGRVRGTFILLCALIASVCGQILLLHGHVAAGTLLYLIGGIPLFISAVRMSRRGARTFDLDAPCDRPYSQGEILVIVLIVAVAFVLRFYSLNVVPRGFEGELSPYMVGSITVRGWAVANAGLDGPWAPLGLLYYPPNYLGILVAGTTPLAIRLGSVFVFLLTLPLFYLFLRAIGGQAAAIVGTLLFAVDPWQIGWSRTDIHPHHVTLWISLLLAWCTILSLQRPTPYRFGACALLMGLSWHQYPSGQSAVVLPIVPIFLTWVFSPRYRASASWYPLLLGVGLVLWLLGHPASTYLADGKLHLDNPFTLTTERTSWGDTAEGLSLIERVYEVVEKAVIHTSHLVRGVFVELPYRFHQEIFPDVPHLTERSVFWCVAAFAVPGILLMMASPLRTNPLVLLWWVVVAAAPAALSSLAYVKRAATLPPVLTIIAALTAATVYRLMSLHLGKGARWSCAMLTVLAAALYVPASLFQWFSVEAGIPPEVHLAQRMRHYLAPGTVVINRFRHGYLRGKMSFLLYNDIVRNQPLAWFGCEHSVCPPEAADDPRRLPEFASRRFEYRWTGLNDTHPDRMSPETWSHAVYVLHLDAGNEEAVPVSAACKHLEEETFIAGTQDARRENVFRIVRCAL